MPIRGNGVGTLVHEATEHASALVRLEAELAKLVDRLGQLRSLVGELLADGLDGACLTHGPFP